MIARWIVVAILSGALHACATSEPSVGSSEEYRTAVARALRYYTHDPDQKRYSITAPWRVLTGEFAVCVRAEVPDGKGGFSPTTDYSMFFIENGRITNVVKDNTAMGCPNRQYGPFAPVQTHQRRS
jgi:hypothetical protein